MDNKSLSQLYIISFLDSFCIGITLPVLNNYIVVALGGSHFLLGVLTAIQTLCQVIIRPLLNSGSRFAGARNLLLISHVMTFLSYFIVIIANDYRLFLVFRIPYFIFNQTQYLIRTMIATQCSSHEQTKEDDVVRHLTSAALILGPFCGGLLYHDSSILCVACVINILTTLSLIMVYQLPENENNSTKLLNPLPTSNCPKYWRFKSVLMILKILTTVGASCFYIKFTLVLAVNLNASASLIGFTIAVHNLIFLAAQFACQLIDNVLTSIQPHFRRLIPTLVLLMTLAMYTLCTTRNYGAYLLAFLGFALAKESFDRLWAIQSEPLSKQMAESWLKVISVFLPIVLGVYSDMYLHQAVQVMAVAPLILATVYAFTQSRGTNVYMKKLEQQILNSFDVVTNKKMK